MKVFYVFLIACIIVGAIAQTDDTTPGGEPDPDTTPGNEPDPDTTPGNEPDPDTTPGNEPDPDTTPGNEPDPDTTPGNEPDPDTTPGNEPDPDTTPGGEPNPTDSTPGEDDNTTPSDPEDPSTVEPPPVTKPGDRCEVAADCTGDNQVCTGPDGDKKCQCKSNYYNEKDVCTAGSQTLIVSSVFILVSYLITQSKHLWF